MGRVLQPFVLYTHSSYLVAYSAETEVYKFRTHRPVYDAEDSGSSTKKCAAVTTPYDKYCGNPLSTNIKVTRPLNWYLCIS